MAPTATQIARIRRKLSLTEASFPEAEINDIFEEAAETYPDYATNAAIMFQVSLYLTCVELMAQAASDVDYDTNERAEKASQRYKNLERLCGVYKKQLDEMIGEEASETLPPPVMWGHMEPKPDRREGRPYNA